MTRILGVAVSCIVLLSPGRLEAQEVGLPLGSTVDSLVLETLDGGAVDLSEFIGHQPVFIQFWASWCEQCKALEPRVAAAHEKFGDRVKFLAVAVAVNQSKRSVTRYLAQHQLPFEFLWDARGRGVRAFKAPTTSYVVIMNAAGSVVYTGVGVDQTFDTALEQVTAPATGS